MANIYTYYETEWTYHNVTRVDDTSFQFEGVGAYATTTIIGRDLGVLGSELFFRGVVSPSQERLTQGLLCRLDMYSKQDIEQDHWEVEKHFVYIKGDKNGAINQTVETIGGFFGFFDHIDIRLEVLPDAELSGGGVIDLTSFAIDDPTLSGDIPEIKDTLIRHEIDLNKYGLELVEILGTEEEEGRLGIAEQNVARLTARELTFTETLTTGGVNLLDNATYGGRDAPDDGLWCSGETVCYVMSRFEDLFVGDLEYPILGRSEQKNIPSPDRPFYLTYVDVYGYKLYSLTYDVVVRDVITTSTDLTRNIGTIVYDGTEQWYLWDYAWPAPMICFYHGTAAPKQGGNVACSIALQGSAANKFLNSFYSSTSQHGLYYFLDSTVVGTSVTEFKAWLASQHEKGTPVTTYFELEAPQEETIEFQEGKKVLDIIGDLIITEVLEMGW